MSLHTIGMILFAVGVPMAFAAAWGFRDELANQPLNDDSDCFHSEVK